MSGHSDETRPLDGLEVSSDRTAAPRINAARLWSGGVATAVVAGLIGLVGVLVVRAIPRLAPSVPGVAVPFDNTDAVVLCTSGAVLALAATGLVHLLLLGAPRPLAYFGWIVGLVAAIGVVLPFLDRVSLPTALATAIIRLVMGIAIGSLVAGAAVSATRRAAGARPTGR